MNISNKPRTIVQWLVYTLYDKVAFHEVLPFADILFLKHPFESEELAGITNPDVLIKAL
ncbi:hypothetical protein [Candidatus Aquicultor secundus]|uniref:hypothetical protein n=1 Tax=Candidatus Aquicultor secundus TaxID=1973895 RepID=UPI00257FCF08|nr:hypothetical protein [Candidatus Aquicultor secundus]NCO65839.1 hypothetical protein [Solirubrobacter sp.]